MNKEKLEHHLAHLKERHADLDKKIKEGYSHYLTDKNLNERIKNILNRNSQELYGCNAEEFKKTHSRTLKHTSLIYNIDSVYRNNM